MTKLLQTFTLFILAVTSGATYSVENSNFNGEDFSARTPNSAKCSGDSEIDTRVSGYPVLLDFRIRVAYSSLYTYLCIVRIAPFPSRRGLFRGPDPQS